MAEIMEDIAYLSQEIGPRPAGTEEEQQAALYIADQMKKRTGFTTNIEDFTAATQPGMVEAVCFGVAALVSLLAIFVRALIIPAFLITLACAVLYLFELIDRPILSNLFARGVSQNVVARYTPGSAGSARNRKVVLVANYDSAKVRRDLGGATFGVLPQLQKASAIGLAALPIIWLIRTLFLLHATGGAVMFFNLLAAAALILALLPVVQFASQKMGTYNEAANNNAAGVASMLEVARMIADGSLSEEEIAASAEARVHGEQAAIEAGVVPEGASLSYDEDVNLTDEERLASAKDAVAALTGRPVHSYNSEYRNAIDLPHMEPPLGYPEDFEGVEQAGDVAQESPAGAAGFQQADEFSAELDAEYGEAYGSSYDESAIGSAEEDEAEQQEEEPVRGAHVAQVNPNEPSWYTTGRAKAVKPAGAEEAPVRRSRYADALDAAMAASRSHFDEAARMLDEGTIERISEMQRTIETRTGVPYDAPLQDLLSEEGAEPEPETPTTPERITITATTMSEDLATQVLEPVAPEPEPEEEAQPEPEVVREDAPKPRPAVAAAAAAPEASGEASQYQAEEALPGATTAMPPINVMGTLGYLRQGGAAPAPSNAPTHDFSQVPSVPERQRENPAPAEDAAGKTPVQEALPLQAEEGSRPSNPLMSEAIPRITLDAKPEAAPEAAAEPEPAPEAPSEQEKRAALLNAIPSLSGAFEPVAPASPEEENVEVSKTGSFAAVGSAAAFNPVGDELVADLEPEERYVDDADDSEFEEAVTESGAFAGPGYVEMPESRIGRFFGRFRKKEAEEEESAADWLEVDEGFNPTEVGAARGGWESFRNEDDFEDAFTFDDEEDDGDDSAWNGGAFSKLRERALGAFGAGEEADGHDDGLEVLSEEDIAEADYAAEAGALAAPVVERTSLTIPEVDPAESERIAEEAKMVYSFRNPSVNTEVWFVALGAEYAGNSGMKAFLAEHAADLRGSIIVNLEATGSGELSFIDNEGVILARRPSSRLKRFLRKASEVTGIAVPNASLGWRESATTVAIRNGFQAMTLAGIEGGKPAYLGQGDDVLENIDEAQVAENAQFVLEIIKNI